MTSTLPVAVLVSGRGSNLEALIRARDAGNLPVRFTLVGSDKPDAPALQRAQQHHIATLALDKRAYADRREYDLALLERIAMSGARMVVLAGFMHVLAADAVAPWHGRMINIHPSLLPRYRGLHTHRKALEAGDREHGASVHYVTAELDGGPVISQARVPVHAGDTSDTLAARVLTREHHLLPATLAWIAAGRVCLENSGIHLDGQPLRTPLQWVDNQLTHA